MWTRGQCIKSNSFNELIVYRLYLNAKKDVPPNFLVSEISLEPDLQNKFSKSELDIVSYLRS